MAPRGPQRVNVFISHSSLEWYSSFHYWNSVSALYDWASLMPAYGDTGNDAIWHFSQFHSSSYCFHIVSPFAILAPNCQQQAQTLPKREHFDLGRENCSQCHLFNSIHYCRGRVLTQGQAPCIQSTGNFKGKTAAPAEIWKSLLNSGKWEWKRISLEPVTPNQGWAWGVWSEWRQEGKQGAPQLPDKWIITILPPKCPPHK